MDELLPCPFCGNAKNIAMVNEKHDHSGGYFIACPECGASTIMRYAMGDDPKPLLIESWNRRAVVAAQPEAVGVIPDCGEAGHDEGRCGNASCMPGKWGKLLRSARDHAYDEEGYTLHPDLAEAVEEVGELLASAPTIQPTQPVQPEPGRPDILERLSYHRLERDDLTLDDCLSYLAKGWREVRGKTERQMVMQILELLASTPPAQAGDAGEPSDGERELATLRAENERLRMDMGAMVREDVDCALAAATEDALQPAANWLLKNVEHCDAGELAHRLVISPEYAIRLENAAIRATKGGKL